jgi:hypothetical protein
VRKLAINPKMQLEATNDKTKFETRAVGIALAKIMGLTSSSVARSTADFVAIAPSAPASARLQQSELAGATRCGVSPCAVTSHRCVRR